MPAQPVSRLATPILVLPNSREKSGLPSVRLNGVRAGTLEVLKLIQAVEVTDVR